MAGSDNTIEAVHERIGSMAESVVHTKERIRELEARLRDLEEKETQEIESLRKSILKIESKIDAFDSANNDSKQKWSMALNFIVQLMWVVTASFVLAKLGFEVGNL